MSEMPEVRGGYVVLKDQHGREQVGQVNYDPSLKQVAWHVTPLTGPHAGVQSQGWMITNVDLQYTQRLDGDRAAVLIQGWDKARQQAQEDGHGFYNGVVADDESRSRVAHLDRGEDPVARKVQQQQGMGQSW